MQDNTSNMTPGGCRVTPESLSRLAELMSRLPASPWGFSRRVPTSVEPNPAAVRGGEGHQGGLLHAYGRQADELVEFVALARNCLPALLLRHSQRPLPAQTAGPSAESLAARLAVLERVVKEVVNGLSDRVAAQAEALSRAAERRQPPGETAAAGPGPWWSELVGQPFGPTTAGSPPAQKPGVEVIDDDGYQD